MGKILDKHIGSCRKNISLMKQETTEVAIYVKQAKPVLAKSEQLMKDYIHCIFGPNKDPKKAEKTFKEFLSLVKQGATAMESISEKRNVLEQDAKRLEKALGRLRQHVAEREKKNLFRSKANTKEAKGLIKAYSQFLGQAKSATEEAFRLWLTFSTMREKYLRRMV